MPFKYNSSGDSALGSCYVTGILPIASTSVSVGFCQQGVKLDFTSPSLCLTEVSVLL